MTGSTNQRPASSQNYYNVQNELRLGDSENKYLQQRSMDSRGTPTAGARNNMTPEMPASSADPYAPSLVYDLLQGKNEWKNIQDIVKLTFKAVCDTVKSQGNAIRDLERQLNQKANTHDILTSLQLKANITDVSRTVADIQVHLDKKQSLEDIMRMMEDRVSRQDLQYLLSNKVSIEELSRVLQTKSNIHEVNMDIT